MTKLERLIEKIRSRPGVEEKILQKKLALIRWMDQFEEFRDPEEREEK